VSSYTHMTQQASNQAVEVMSYRA